MITVSALTWWLLWAWLLVSVPFVVGFFWLFWLLTREQQTLFEKDNEPWDRDYGDRPGEFSADRVHLVRKDGQ